MSPDDTAAVTGNVGALSAGVGDDALEPVPVCHQPFPRRPRGLRGRERLRGTDFLERQADMLSEFLDDLPVRLAAAVLVIGDDLFRARLDDADAGIPIGTIGRDLELQHRVALPRVQAVLQHEHTRPACCERLIEKTRAPHETVDFLV